MSWPGVRRKGAIVGLAAAVAFGVGAPLAKRLLDDAGPQLLAGLLYLGAFIVLAAVAPLRRQGSEARLQSADAPRLAGLVVCGGILAPVLLLIGLERVSGSTGSLLLNLEAVFTIVIGIVVFGEHLGRRAVLGAAVVLGGATMLSFGGGAGFDAAGTLCIAAACLLWGVDNNLTQSLTLRDPFSIAAVKTGIAAVVNLTIALALGAALPPANVLTAALCLGAISYGVSIVLDTYALRALGAAREAVVFASAPFVGAVLALPLLSETLTPADVAAGLAMAGGIALMFAEQHDHHHVHEPAEHEHAHEHDEHHQHDHDPAMTVRTPHSHRHRHERLVHAHPHVSDLHHRHRHG